MSNDLETKTLREYLVKIEDSRKRVKVLKSALETRGEGDSKFPVGSIPYRYTSPRNGSTQLASTYVTLTWEDVEPFIQRELTETEAWLMEAEANFNAMQRLCGLHKETPNGR